MGGQGSPAQATFKEERMVKMATDSSSSASSLSSLSSSGMLRMSGLASGLDTESMVKSLMNAQKAKYNKMIQKQQQMDWMKAAQLDINNQLKTFRDTYFSAASPSTNMLSPSSILMFKVTADTNSSVTLSATKDAFAGSHVINSITSIASGASSSSAAQVSASGLSLDTQLSSLALNTPLTFDGNGQMSFKINNSTFTFNSTDTLRTMMSTVNSDTTANVQMTYSSLTGKFAIANKTMGSASSLDIKNLTGNAFAATGSAFGIAEGTFTNGTDAVLSIDGVSVTKSTNNFTIDGTTYNLKGTTSTPINFSVNQDVDGAVSNIKKFVDAYNTLINNLTSKISEQKDPAYTPLTDDQKAEMSQAQIDQWETKAKTGILSNDSYIQSLMQNMRRGFFDKVTGAGTNPASIGLSTISYLTGGAIIVDETKLRQALTSNPQQVADIFTDTSTSTNATTKYNDSGLAARMQTTLNSYVNDYSGYRTDSFNTQYKGLTTDITNEKTRLSAKEDQYWNQFTKMEQAIASMNQQSSWLSQQFSSSSNG